MIFLNMMLGAYGLLIALIMLIIVILIEAVFISKRLFRQLINPQVIFAVSLSNIISTIFGFLTLGIFWRALIDWSIDVFNLSIDYSSIYFVIAFYLIAWILTVIIEFPINLTMLKSKEVKRKVFLNTIYANVITYLLLGFAARGLI